MNKMKLLLTGLLIMSCLPFLSNSLQAGELIKEGSHINAITLLSYHAIVLVGSGILINLAMNDITNYVIKKNYFNKLYTLELLEKKAERFYKYSNNSIKKYFTERYVGRNIDNNNYDFLNIFEQETQTKLFLALKEYADACNKCDIGPFYGWKVPSDSEIIIKEANQRDQETTRKHLENTIKEAKETLNTPKWLSYIPTVINSLMLGAITIGAYQLAKTGYAQILYDSLYYYRKGDGYRRQQMEKSL